jgi:phosphatidylglycerol:prolipoprotein diacylglycerol transferase
MPVGTVLDVTIPALLLGQAIGRLGCLFGGCCAGLPTTSRWGVWSSDRRIAGSPDRGEARARAIDGVRVRRQPLAYLIVRQLLFPLRGLPRKTAHGRVITLAVASAALIGAGVTAILG